MNLHRVRLSKGRGAALGARRLRVAYSRLAAYCGRRNPKRGSSIAACNCTYELPDRQYVNCSFQQRLGFIRSIPQPRNPSLPHHGVALGECRHLSRSLCRV